MLLTGTAQTVEYELWILLWKLNIEFNENVKQNLLLWKKNKNTLNVFNTVESYIVHSMKTCLGLYTNKISFISVK